MPTLPDLLIPLGICGGLLAYPVLQALTTWRMQRRWRLLSVVPLVPMAFVLALTVLALIEDSNLWPILLIFTAPLALLYLALLWLALGLAHAWRRPRCHS